MFCLMSISLLTNKCTGGPFKQLFKIFFVKLCLHYKQLLSMVYRQGETSISLNKVEESVKVQVDQEIIFP